MASSSDEDIDEVLGGLEACAERMCELIFDAQSTAGLLRIVDTMHRVARKLQVPGHAVINQLRMQATGQELGGTVSSALADRLRITKPDADRLVAEAADLGPRRALTGQPLAPLLPATR